MSTRRTEIRDYNEVDILYMLMSYVNSSTNEDMHYTIAHTILTHVDEIPKLSINTLAKMCFTSPATISRFCKELKCKNFSAFKKELSIALNIAENEIHIDEKEKERIERDPQRTVNLIYNETIDSLFKGQRSVEIRDVDEICQMIHDAEDVHVMGYQFSKIVGTDFQLKMLKLKKFIYAFANRGEDISRIDAIGKDSLVIILTVRARKELMDNLVKAAKDKGARILMITMNKDYTNDQVDHFYYLEGEESEFTQSSLMGSIDFMSLLNVIYVRYGILYGPGDTK